MASRRQGRLRLYRRLTVFLIALLLSIAPGLCLYFGPAPIWDSVDVSSLPTELPGEPSLQALHRLLLGSTGYTLLEWTLVCFALSIASLAFVQSNAQREPASPLVCMVATWCAAITLFHLLAFHGFSMEVVNLTEFVHLNWTIAQTLTALLFLTAGSLVLRRADHTPLPPRLLFLFGLAITTMAFLVIFFTGKAASLPLLLEPEGLLKRPADLLPLVLFGACALFLFPRIDRVCQSHFSLALWASSLPLIASQVYMAYFSPGLFDPGFTAAQFARTSAFVLIFAGLVVDFSQTQRVEQALQQRLAASDRQVNILVNNALEAIITFDERCRVTLWNPRAEEIFGTSRTDALGRDLLDLLFDEQSNGNGRDEFIHDFHLLRDDPSQIASPTTRRMFFYPPEGSPVPLEYSMICARSHRHTVFALLLRDVSLREELQMQMIQMDRLAAVGTLAAGVVHEINNPLTFLLTHLALATERLDDASSSLDTCRLDLDTLSERCDEPILQDLLEGIATSRSLFHDMASSLSTATDGAERVHRIVHDMRLFSHVTPEEIQPISVQEPLDVAIRMTRGEVHRIAELSVESEPDLPLIRADATRLSQVFVNLIMNAIQAMEQVPDRNHRLTISLALHDDSLHISFTDTGSGIPPHIQRRIFSPFFTTKPAGAGTGLGLSLSRRIIEDFQGSISVDSATDEGSTFLIQLPAYYP